MILAGDIGGTKTVLARWEYRAGVLDKVREATFKSADYASLEDVIATFRQDDRYDVACFGVAGPIVDGESKITNLPWVLRERELATSIGVRRAKLLNDLEAAAYGMLHLAPESVLTLQEGSKFTPGTIAVLAAGTGLGEAILQWDGARYHPMPTEGGHSTFAPQTDEEYALRTFLAARLGVEHVSWERVVSGPAFPMIYEFLLSRGGDEPAWLAERLAKEPPSAVITEVGLRGDEPLTKRVCELFASWYGAEAGNHALKCLALGGVFLSGNIAKVLFPKLREAFLRGFLHKGRFSALLASLPVRVALDPKVPLIGSAHYAATL